MRAMTETIIAGVMRAGAFSPNHIGNDAMIFNMVADQLRKRGCIVNVYSEEQLQNGEIKEGIIMNMCREHQSMHALQALEDKGAIVVNSGYGIENCIRERMTRILMGVGVPHPKSLIVNTNENVADDLKAAGISACWIKRGDFHTMHREDVSFVRHAEEAQEVLHEYFLRGIPRAVINVHLEGDLVKFYGIKDTNFFFYFYPFNTSNSKYGLEEINGKPKEFAIDEPRLRAICHKAADALGIEVYGGDCIVSADGDIKIIDFNDWPSFAPCRVDAAPQIAKRILTIVKENR